MTSMATTRGLVDTSAPASTLQQVQWGIAAGTGDAITLTVPANVVPVDGMGICFRALAANTLTNPTLAVQGPDTVVVGPYPITKGANAVLAASDIPGNLAEEFVRLNATNKVWVLVNKS